MLRWGGDCGRHTFIQAGSWQCLLSAYHTYLKKWYWLWTLWCSQPLRQLYFRRNTAGGAKHSSKNGKPRNLEWYQVFCVNKASCGQGRKCECNKWIWWLSVLGFWIFLLKPLIVLTRTELPNSTQEAPSSIVCRVNASEGSLEGWALLLSVVGLLLQGPE